MLTAIGHNFWNQASQIQPRVFRRKAYRDRSDEVATYSGSLTAIIVVQSVEDRNAGNSA